MSQPVRMREFRVTAGITHRDSHVIDRYFHDVSRYRPLAADEEARLAWRIRQGDKAAFGRLVSSNLRFVVTVAKQYQHRGLPLCDLIAEGNVGLMEAARNFDETKGFKFISYAVWWIRQRIFKALEDQSRLIRIPKRHSDMHTHLQALRARLEQQLQRQPTEAELAGAAELSLERLHEVLHHTAFACPLEAPMADGQLSLLEVYASPDEPADALLQLQDQPVLLNAVLKELNERERRVVLLSFGFGADREYNDYEIGERLGISSQLVQIARNKALSKLRLEKTVHLLA